VLRARYLISSKILKNLLLLTVVVSFFCSCASVWAFQSSWRLKQGVRASLRSAKERIPSELLSRVQWELASEESHWRLVPFLEARRDLDNSVWSRVELGGEVGFNPFKWFYLGQGLHYAWLDPDDNDPEWELRMLLLAPLPWTVREKQVEVYLVSEYTYNLGEGKGTRNEVGVGVRVPLPWERLSTTLGWRHVDLIHADDMDQFEGTLVARF